MTSIGEISEFSMTDKSQNALEILPATLEDIPLILSFIKELAVYEKLSHEVVANEVLLEQTLFGDKKVAEVIIGYFQGQAVGFAIFFYNYSTFVGRPGIYLEDLYVQPEHRGQGYGRSLFTYIANLAVEQGCGRLEWSVLDWNKPAIDFYKLLGATPMDEWTTFRLAGDGLERIATDPYGA